LLIHAGLKYFFRPVTDLKQGINEGRYCAAFGKHDDQSDQQKNDDDGDQPEFFMVSDEIPEFFKDTQFCHMSCSC
jgi:hypothetical protein